jgi:hypothetical protein
VNVLIGQNGLLTTSILVGGLNLVSNRPWLAGGILGLMVIKPQLAILLPFALSAGREWRAFGGAAISSLALLGAALLLFGPSAYEGFFGMLPNYARYMKLNAWPWGELASVYAFGRASGISPTASMTLQVASAFGAIVITCHAWAVRHPNRIPILAASTLLVPPYLLNYDSLLLIVPIGYFLRERSSRPVAFAVWVSCLSALGTYLDVYSGPNTVTLGALVSLYFLYAPPRQRHEETREAPNQHSEAAAIS